MTTTYFLGANSCRGFVSLYHDFPPDPAAFLHIIKSGPGTGKSSFLRRLGKEAEGRGMDVHYVLCSGDPDSLDGVYIPALGQAWVDGTAPHVIEPRIFGADSDYINLGAFFRQPFDDSEKEALRALTNTYRAHYQRAYRLLDHYASGSTNYEPAPDMTLHSVINALPKRNAPAITHYRFLSAISCQGVVHLSDMLSAYQQVPCSTNSLSKAADEIQGLGWSTIRCPSPLEPANLETLLLPEAKVAFTAYRTDDKKTAPVLQEAIQELREAKALHDELEAVYRRHMHFSALDDYTNTTISKIFAQPRPIP